MKMIISKMIITNFKGVKHLEIDFKDVTNIYAQNGGFKTTIVDAWFYCLYGKDSHDRQDFNIKNTVDTSLNRGDHSVEIHVTTGNNLDVFKRVLREKWTKPKGQRDQVYSGNETLFYCNDVPMQAKEYSAKINSIIGEGAIKLLTNPNHFNSLKWTERREIIFELAGKISDEEIASSRPEFVSLLAAIGNKTLKGYKNEISAKKKRLKEDLTAIPHRIDELQLSLPEQKDYSQIEAKIALKNEEVYTIESSMADSTLAYDEKCKVIQAKQAEIHQLKTKLNQIEFRIKSEMQDSANKLKNERQDLLRSIEDIERDIKSKNLLVSSSTLKVESLDVKTKDLRTKWEDKNATVFKMSDDDTICPSCERSLDAGVVSLKSEQLEANFIKDKNRVLASIVDEATSHKSEVESTNNLLVTLTKSLSALEGQLKNLQDSLVKFDEENSVPLGGVSLEFKLAKDFEYVQTDAKVKDLESQPVEKIEIDLSDLKEKKRLITIEIDALKKELSSKEQRETTLSRISELENDESNLAQQIADLENIEFNIDSFTRAKIETTEARINGMFKYVTFKMFNRQVNGEDDETCETMYNGVPFSDLNTAGKIWAGIDIINTLSKHYGLSAPIFLDNRESVTMIPEIDSQIINLIVSPEDKTLRVA